VFFSLLSQAGCFPWTVAWLQELAVFLQTPGDLEVDPTWASMLPPPPSNLVDSTAKLSKQLLGLERSEVDPAEVRSAGLQPSAQLAYCTDSKW
jgi:hypothetical protein